MRAGSGRYEAAGGAPAAPSPAAGAGGRGTGVERGALDLAQTGFDAHGLGVIALVPLGVVSGYGKRILRTDGEADHGERRGLGIVEIGKLDVPGQTGKAGRWSPG